MKIAVSACLLGEKCRYDGETKQDESVLEMLKGAEVIPFCPEAPVLGTPRERISVVYSKEHGYTLIGDVSKIEVTSAIKLETQKMIDGYPDLDKIILKSKSPSCGIGTTPMMSTEGSLLCYGNGIAAQMLLEAFSEIDVIDEKNF